jgi:hypothetical protein
MSSDHREYKKMNPHEQTVKYFEGHLVSRSNIKRLERETEDLRQQLNDIKL